MSAFDDLLNFGGDLPENKGETAGLVQNTDGGDLVDFGFGSSNDNRAKLSFETNNSNMATDLSEPLFNLGSAPVQKGEQQDSSNPLHDFIESEDTNGHGEDIITNEDLLGGCVDGEDISNSGPVISDELDVKEDTHMLGTQPRDITEYREKSESEASEEQDNFRNIENIETENVENANETSDFIGYKTTEVEDVVNDPNIYIPETHEKEQVHFSEMDSVSQKFESETTSHEESTPQRVAAKEDMGKAGEYESTSIIKSDVAKESDQPQAELPEVGMAKNLVNRFKSIQEEKAQPVASSKRVSPTREMEKVEYESQPQQSNIHYETKTEAGVFESEPTTREDVVKSGETTEDYQPEKGYAKNIMNKFKEIQTESSKYKAHEKRAITPDRSGKVEYVSEPRGQHIVFDDAPAEAGVYENIPKEDADVIRAADKSEEILPEQGTAKSLLSKFKQMESESGHKPPASHKREITPDRSGKVEYVSEPHGFLEKYEPKIEVGEFESTPSKRAEVIRAEDQAEDILPEVGSAKKTMERFKEIQKQQMTSVNASRNKEFTPPREHTQAHASSGIVESTPIVRADVVKSGESAPEELPEKGTTKNILNKFKEIQSSTPQSTSPGRRLKEFTPPPESGVYENTPKEHLVIETRQSESGILESMPSRSNADVSRGRDALTPEQELPEQGMAKNLVFKWKQMESTSGNAKSTSPKFKEFTPPRDNRTPRSPKSPSQDINNGVHPSELPGQYQPQESSCVHENDPDVKKDVFRESDGNFEADLPPPNTTASMLQKFKTIQDKAKEDQETAAAAAARDDFPLPTDPEGKNIQHQ